MARRRTAGVACVLCPLICWWVCSSCAIAGVSTISSSGATSELKANGQQKTNQVSTVREKCILLPACYSFLCQARPSKQDIRGKEKQKWKQNTNETGWEPWKTSSFWMSQMIKEWRRQKCRECSRATSHSDPLSQSLRKPLFLSLSSDKSPFTSL